MKHKNNFGLIIANRGFFPEILIQEGREQIIKYFNDNGYNIITLSTEDSKLGAVSNLEEAQKCSNLFDNYRKEIDGIILTLPNFGDERSVANAIKHSNLNVPILVHAFNDDLNDMSLARRRDSFCGKLSICNNLYQYGFKYSITQKHTEDIGDAEFSEDIDWFAATCRVVKKLRNARVGALGARTGPFNTVRFSEKLLEASGISTEVLDLSDFLVAVNRLKDSDTAVKKKLESFSNYIKLEQVSEGALLRMSKFAVSLDNWIKEYKLDATAIQCWTALQDNFGMVPCSIMSKLSEELNPSACEVDIPGAVGMLALQAASGSPSAIIDWNNNYGTDADKCVIFHCSNLPKSYLEDPIMGIQEIISNSVGVENAAGACLGRIKQGPFTYCRISTDDVVGEIKAYVGEGEFTDDKLQSFGGYGVARIEDFQELLAYACENGFEHHASISKSLVADSIYEAFSNYFDWDVYYHI
jgi:L-fucose isomerase-like protein